MGLAGCNFPRDCARGFSHSFGSHLSYIFCNIASQLVFARGLPYGLYTKFVAMNWRSEGFGHEFVNLIIAHIGGKRK